MSSPLINRVSVASVVLALGLMVGIHVSIAVAPDDVQMLIFETSHEAQNRTELIAADTRSGQLVRVTSGRDPQWSPDGRYLAFTRYLQNGSYLFLRDMATGTERALGRAGRQAILPKWTPRGNRLCWTALVGFGNSERSIDCYDMQSDETFRWLELDYAVQDLNFSPDGQLVLMRSMFSATFMGSALGERSATYQGVLSADWSPAGDMLVAVVRADYAHTKLVSIDVDANAHIDMGIMHTLITDTASIEQYAAPVWSPEGTTIAFLGQVNSRWGLFVLEVATGNAQHLTKDLNGDIRDAAWSLDGRYLYAIANQGLDTRILWWDAWSNQLVTPEWSAQFKVYRLAWRPQLQ